VSFTELIGLIEFMYKGEVNVLEKNLPSFLRMAESLRIRGLYENAGTAKSDVRNRNENVEESNESDGNDDSQSQPTSLSDSHTTPGMKNARQSSASSEDSHNPKSWQPAIVNNPFALALAGNKKQSSVNSGTSSASNSKKIKTESLESIVNNSLNEVEKTPDFEKLMNPASFMQESLSSEMELATQEFLMSNASDFIGLGDVSAEQPGSSASLVFGIGTLVNIKLFAFDLHFQTYNFYIQETQDSKTIYKLKVTSIEIK